MLGSLGQMLVFQVGVELQVVHLTDEYWKLVVCAMESTL